jgi:hypothetical protein
LESRYVVGEENMDHRESGGVGRRRNRGAIGALIYFAYDNVGDDQGHVLRMTVGGSTDWDQTTGRDHIGKSSVAVSGGVAYVVAGNFPSNPTQGAWIVAVNSTGVLWDHKVDSRTEDEQGSSPAIASGYLFTGGMTSDGTSSGAFLYAFRDP